MLLREQKTQAETQPSILARVGGESKGEEEHTTAQALGRCPRN